MKCFKFSLTRFAFYPVYPVHQCEKRALRIVLNHPILQVRGNLL